MTKLVFAVALCSVLLIAVSGQEQEEVKPKENNCPPNVTFACKDCNTWLLCNGNGEEITTQPCVSPYPYCLNGQCISDMTPNCAAHNHTFSCTSDGYFPDPHDCAKYYYCLNGKVDKAYICPDKWNVDTNTFTCKRTQPNNCGMKCVANQIIVHPINKKYFGFCLNENVIEMYACKENYEYIPGVGCKYKCSLEGYYPGETPEQFVICIKTGAKFNYREYDCPTGMKYDNTKKVCA